MLRRFTQQKSLTAWPGLRQTAAMFHADWSVSHYIVPPREKSATLRCDLSSKFIYHFLFRTPQTWLTMLFSGSDNPKHCLIPLVDLLGPHLMVPLAHLSLPSNQHVDRFSRFCRADERDEQTDKPRYSVCSNRPHRAIVAMWPIKWRGRPYIHTCRSYVHTPHNIDRHAITQAIPTLNFTSGWVADSSDFGLVGEQSSPKWEIPGPGLRRTTVQNLTPLASYIFVGEIHTNKQNYKQ